MTIESLSTLHHVGLDDVDAGIIECICHVERAPIRSHDKARERIMGASQLVAHLVRVCEAVEAEWPAIHYGESQLSRSSRRVRREVPGEALIQHEAKG